jgi:hypothetical protein
MTRMDSFLPISSTDTSSFSGSFSGLFRDLGREVRTAPDLALRRLVLALVWVFGSS